MENKEGEKFMRPGLPVIMLPEYLNIVDLLSSFAQKLEEYLGQPRF